jgi:type II secretory pathway pseudopilin PulG
MPSEQGFTLFELIAYVLLLSMLALGAAYGTVNIIRIGSQATASLNASVQVYRAWSSLTHIIEDASYVQELPCTQPMCKTWEFTGIGSEGDKSIVTVATTSEARCSTGLWGWNITISSSGNASNTDTLRVYTSSSQDLPIRLRRLSLGRAPTPMQMFQLHFGACTSLSPAPEISTWVRLGWFASLRHRHGRSYLGKGG